MIAGFGSAVDAVAALWFDAEGRVLRFLVTRWHATSWRSRLEEKIEEEDVTMQCASRFTRTDVSLNRPRWERSLPTNSSGSAFPH